MRLRIKITPDNQTHDLSQYTGFIYNCVKTKGLLSTQYFVIAPINNKGLYYEMIASYDDDTDDEHHDKNHIKWDLDREIANNNNNGYIYKITYETLTEETADDSVKNEKLLESLSLKPYAMVFPDPALSVLGKVLFPHLVPPDLN
jgi:hypothetical protein